LKSVKQRLQVLLLDFTRVPAIDSSAATSLSRIIEKCATADIAVWLCAANVPVTRMLTATGCLPSGEEMHGDIDQTIVKWEESILASSAESTSSSFESWLAEEFPDQTIVQRLLERLETVRLESGNYLFRKDERSDALFWVQSGRLAARQKSEDGKGRRLVAFRTGSTIGEMGVFRQMPRSADVVAEEPCVLRKLTHQQIEEIEREDSELALQLKNLFVRRLANRLDSLNRQVVALSA
jgi:SulP family sulfate permease